MALYKARRSIVGCVYLHREKEMMQNDAKLNMNVVKTCHDVVNEGEEEETEINAGFE